MPESGYTMDCADMHQGEAGTMPDIKEEITSYQYEFRVQRLEDQQSYNVALLSLYYKDKLLCSAAFLPGDEPLPPPKQHIDGWVAVAYRYDWLHDVVDMLRAEKPVYFLWNRESGTARTTTEEEPTGEDERSGLLSLLFD